MEDLLWKLPLFDDLYLSMQGQNIMLVDSYLRNFESSLRTQLFEMERTPVASALFVSALSQMWIFAAYELLRTWRQRVQDLKRQAQQPQKPAVQRGSPLRQLWELTWQEELRKLQKNKNYATELDEAYAKVEPLFRRIEALRMNLAKHEVPKRSQRALAPGYGRIDGFDGSIYWQVDLGDNFVDIVSRRSLADHLRGIVIGHVLEGDNAEADDDGETDLVPKRKTRKRKTRKRKTRQRKTHKK